MRRFAIPAVIAALSPLACNAIFGLNDLEFSDGGADTDTETADDPPTITRVDGDGTALAVNDVTGATAGISDAEPASHRFQTEWVIQGTRLDTVTSVALAQNGGDAVFGAADGLELETGGTDMQRNLILPAALAAGAFTLTLGNGFGDAVAQVYVLQGEKGDPGEGLSCDGTSCTVAGNQNLIVNGAITAETGEFSSLTVDDLAVQTSYWLPECPQGYARDASTSEIVLCSRGADEVVKVGDFWIDRYEASLWSSPSCSGTQYGAAGDDYPSTFPDNGNWTAPLYACSVAGVTPSAHATWFQAQQACTLSGKRLCSNEEWQAAVAGTHDPGAAETGAQCRIAATNTGPRDTGSAGDAPGDADACVSHWGAEDLIGNLKEWVSWWNQAGTTAADFESGAIANGVWGSEFGDDSTWNVNGSAFHGVDTGFTTGLPSAGVRGGNWNDAAGAGSFSVVLSNVASHENDRLGLRCCMNR